MRFYLPRREGESEMDYAIRIMDPAEVAEIQAAADASAERIIAAMSEARDAAKSRRQVSAAPEPTP